MTAEVINLMKSGLRISKGNLNFIIDCKLLFNFFLCPFSFPALFGYISMYTVNLPPLSSLFLSPAGKQYKHFLSQVYLLLCLINMHVFGTQLGSAGMLSNISFFIYMRLGGVTYGASWLS